MKRYILLLLATLFVSNMLGQVEFSVEFVFQDAVGNSDTLVLGYDDSASDSIDVNLGEENLVSSWDEVFEVRVTNAQSSRDVYDTLFTPTIQTKRQIIDYLCSRDRANSSQPIFIDVKALNWPVTVNWDPSAFSAYCNLKSQMGFVSQADVGYNLADRSSVSSSQFYADDRPNDTYHTINGDTIDSVFWIAFSDSANIVTIQGNEKTGFHIFPNPARNHLNIEYLKTSFATIQHYKIINLQGITIKEGQYDCDCPIDIEEIPEGIYFLEMFHSNRTSITRKFLKE